MSRSVQLTTRIVSGEPKDSLGVAEFLQAPIEAFGQPVCRLGLASHGRTEITPDDVLHALDAGVNFLNWPGVADSPGGDDAFSEAISSLGSRRASVVVCVQFGARTARDAADELQMILSTLHTDYVDVLTLYYVETPEEWQVLSAPRGVVEYLRDAQRDGVVRTLGITSHQRALAANIARSGMIDSLMIRYNAAHRGAEQQIFPVTDALRMPVIAYTGATLGRPSPADDGRPSGIHRAPSRRLVPIRTPVKVRHSDPGRSTYPVRARPRSRSASGDRTAFVYGVRAASRPWSSCPATFTRFSMSAKRISRLRDGAIRQSISESTRRKKDYANST